MSCPVNTVLSNAAANGYFKVDPGTLDVIIAQLTCDLITAVSAGGGGLVGTGSPEGVVTANPGQTYLDTTGDTFWVKKTGTGNTGWLNLI